MEKHASAEASEDFPDTAEILLLLEKFVFRFPVLNSGKPLPRLNVKDDDEVRSNGELLVHPLDFSGIDPLCPLIGHRREIIPVKDNNFSAPEGRLEVFRDVLPSIPDEKIQLLGGSQGAGPGGFPLDGPSPSAPGWLTKENGLPIPISEPSQKGPGLGCFTGPVDPFKNDENAFWELHG